jgi:hypothetical protein
LDDIAEYAKVKDECRGVDADSAGVAGALVEDMPDEVETLDS